MAKELNVDDLLQVAGGCSGSYTSSQICQAIATYLQGQGYSTGGSSEEELRTIVKSMSEAQENALRNYLLNSVGIPNSCLPTWLQSIPKASILRQQATDGYDTEAFVASIANLNIKL